MAEFKSTVSKLPLLVGLSITGTLGLAKPALPLLTTTMTALAVSSAFTVAAQEVPDIPEDPEEDEGPEEDGDEEGLEGDEDEEDPEDEADLEPDDIEDLDDDPAEDDPAEDSLDDEPVDEDDEDSEDEDADEDADTESFEEESDESEPNESPEEQEGTEPDEDETSDEVEDEEETVEEASEREPEREEDKDDDDQDEQTETDVDETDFDSEGYPTRRSEILAFDTDAETLRIAEGLGFRLIERRQLPAIGATLDRLSVPSDYSSPGGAIDALEDALPAAPFDYNHIYVLPEDEAQTDTSSVMRLGRAGSGHNVRIGVIDTVPDTKHPSLRGKRVQYRDFAKSGGRDSTHATAVVSILVGEDTEHGYSGLLPDASVYAANIFSLNRKGEPETDAFAMIAALDWLAGQDVGVISISIAGPPSNVLEEMLNRLDARGHIVVAAVGNDGPAAPPLYPAAYDPVIGVTATDLRDRSYRRAGRGDHVDFSAPGVRVSAAAATNGNYASFTGTSFATPVVAAVMALSLPQRSPSAAPRILLPTRDLGEPGRDAIYGDGLIQVGGR